MRDHYVAVDRERLIAWLHARPERRRQDGDALEWEWWRDGSRSNPDMVTTLGRVTMDGRRISAFTRSSERAYRLGRLLAESGAVRHERREHAPAQYDVNMLQRELGLRIPEE